ncbi:hypothetical protein BH767_gp68 [Gordonia phage Cozz]|uniref:Uncharacterized protein n=2 Tax=Emalynvirus cozz TaxID=2560490 RepID=A0A4Y5NZA8_9CAUD|nr:hypothetical protein BH767_gp68 [Gordonia phage Cozz]ANA85774.1 hypothetical protein PBI_COZZ_68 [Gordonia phage Cozz]QCW22401.1 hypothetical protein SEA_AGATHA_69 [Gordonia phage Agatha]QGH76696.1 hypothetical protein PBI_QUASAR_69 [Gordonia phage Quasar]
MHGEPARPGAPSLRIIEKEGGIVAESVELLDRQSEMRFDSSIFSQLMANGNIVSRPHDAEDEVVTYDFHFANGSWVYRGVGTEDLVNGSTAIVLQEVTDES